MTKDGRISVHRQRFRFTEGLIIGNSPASLYGRKLEFKSDVIVMMYSYDSLYNWNGYDRNQRQGPKFTNSAYKVIKLVFGL